VIVGSNHRANVRQVSMENSGPAQEAAEAQLEQASLIEADSILQQEKKKCPRSAVLLSVCLNVLVLVYLSHSVQCIKTRWGKRSSE